MKELLTSKQKSLALLRRMVAEIWSAHREKDHESYNECEQVECAWCENTREALTILESPDETNGDAADEDERKALRSAIQAAIYTLRGECTQEERDHRIHWLEIALGDAEPAEPRADCELIEKLAHWLVHDDDCDAINGRAAFDDPCSCGLDAAIAGVNRSALKAEAQPETEAKSAAPMKLKCGNIEANVDHDGSISIAQGLDLVAVSLEQVAPLSVWLALHAKTGAES